MAKSYFSQAFGSSFKDCFATDGTTLEDDGAIE
ncbi:hypothetical protein COLO4_09025 [Corchorus olitorius]|uniref:Uncharacterized protein n=1 Tax=Corchorus olitorius TaxID=93759 RepID=A0A1R3KDH8_9ROSI|nr:hypothetical protein COLO4_09025 [Corchorus olitorius]